MLMFLGIFLLMVYTVSLIKGSLFKGFLKKIHSKDYSKVDEGNTEELVEVWKDAGKSCLYIIVVLVIFLLLCIFTVKALAVDIFIYPTLVVMTLIIGNVVIGLSKASKAKGEEAEKKEYKVSFKNQLHKVLYIAYIIYILVLIIL